MKTHIIEVTNGQANWGKFLVGKFDEEWERTSEVDTGRHLLRAIGWGAGREHLLVLDLQTGEGAMFLPTGLASADLNKHRIWVCPLFEPFLAWLYAYIKERQQLDDHLWWQTLPLHLDLPDAPFAMQGYRREGR